MNYRYLDSSEKTERMKAMRKDNRALEMKMKRLEAKLASVFESDGVALDETTSNDMERMIEEHDNGIMGETEEGSFQHIFWQQQKKALKRDGVNKKGIRWHPLIIRWCLYLRHQSSKAYDLIRDSGCIALPSQRTLRDYSNAVKAGVGFSEEVDLQLLDVARLKSSPSHSLVGILIDEMYIKEDLVYNKHDGRLVGFANLGDINNHLTRFEQQLESNNSTPALAKTIVAFMVKGLFSSLRFCYAQFPCCTLVGEQLFTLFWETVFRLERLGFKVMLHINN